jgi:hypothetical protein
MVTTDKVQGMQRKVVLVTVGVIALAVVAAKLFAPSYVTSLRQSRELIRRQNLLTIRRQTQMPHLRWHVHAEASRQPHGDSILSAHQPTRTTQYT